MISLTSCEVGRTGDNIRPILEERTLEGLVPLLKSGHPGLKPQGFPPALDHCHHLHFPFMLPNRNNKFITWQFPVVLFHLSPVTQVKVDLCGLKQETRISGTSRFKQGIIRVDSVSASPGDRSREISSPVIS